jgi:hypothetical protein
VRLREENICQKGSGFMPAATSCGDFGPPDFLAKAGFTLAS